MPYSSSSVRVTKNPDGNFSGTKRAAGVKGYPRRPKSRGPKDLQLEFGAPRLQFSYNLSNCYCPPKFVLIWSKYLFVESLRKQVCDQMLPLAPNPVSNTLSKQWPRHRHYQTKATDQQTNKNKRSISKPTVKQTNAKNTGKDTLTGIIIMIHVFRIIIFQC